MKEAIPMKKNKPKKEKQVIEKPVFKKIEVDTHRQVFWDSFLGILFLSLCVSTLICLLPVCVYEELVCLDGVFCWKIPLILILSVAYVLLVWDDATEACDKEGEVYEKKVQIGFVECDKESNKNE